MAAVELLLDEPRWRYTARSNMTGLYSQTGRLRAWRDDSERLIAMLSLRGVLPGQPGCLVDIGCDIPDQIRARFPDHDLEIFAYEHSWWGDFACYYRAGRAGDGTQRWVSVDWSVLKERLGEAFVYDEDEDPSPGAA
jgi:hypothetical protein